MAKYNSDRCLVCSALAAPLILSRWLFLVLKAQYVRLNGSFPPR